MLWHHLLPIFESFPRAVVPHFVRRTQHRAGISNGPASYRAAVKNRDVTEEAHIEKAAERNTGPPEPAMHLPACLGQGFRCPATSHLHYCDPVSLLDEAQRTHTPAETGADDDEIKIELFV